MEDAGAMEAKGPRSIEPFTPFQSHRYRPDCSLLRRRGMGFGYNPSFDHGNLLKVGSRHFASPARPCKKLCKTPSMEEARHVAWQSLSVDRGRLRHSLFLGAAPAQSHSGDHAERAQRVLEIPFAAPGVHGS